MFEGYMDQQVRCADWFEVPVKEGKCSVALSHHPHGYCRLPEALHLEEEKGEVDLVDDVVQRLARLEHSVLLGHVFSHLLYGSHIVGWGVVEVTPEEADFHMIPKFLIALEVADIHAGHDLQLQLNSLFPHHSLAYPQLLRLQQVSAAVLPEVSVKQVIERIANLCVQGNYLCPDFHHGCLRHMHYGLGCSSTKVLAFREGTP